jgi:hypothetical protein
MIDLGFEVHSNRESHSAEIIKSRKRLKNSMSKRSKTAITKSKVRSAISNGKHVLSNVDHRSLEMRRLRDLLADHVSDLGSDISHSEKLLASRASMIALLCEMTERTFIEKKLRVSDREVACYLHAVGNLNRVLVTLGLKRRQRDITPTVDEYLREQEQQEDAP